MCNKQLPYKNMQDEELDLYVFVCGGGSCCNMSGCMHTLDQMRNCQAMLNDETL